MVQYPSSSQPSCDFGHLVSVRQIEWFEEVYVLWAYAKDREELEDPMVAILDFEFGDDDRLVTAEEKDEFVAHILLANPPSR